MNAARFTICLSLCSAALLGCTTTDSDEADQGASAPLKTVYGYEFIADKVDAAVTAPAAPADVPARLAPELIRDVVRGGFASLAACKTNGAAGDLTVRFHIDEDGSAHGAHITAGAAGPAAACITAAVNAMHFPTSHGGTIEVIYPLVY